jgi:hypothetical protein
MQRGADNVTTDRATISRAMPRIQNTGRHGRLLAHIRVNGGHSRALRCDAAAAVGYMPWHVTRRID